VGGGRYKEMGKEGKYGGNIMYLCMKNGKMRPVETIPGMGRVIKKNDGGVNSTMIYYKNFCKCHNVPSKIIRL
jgi:hypothetical protein